MNLTRKINVWFKYNVVFKGKVEEHYYAIERFPNLRRHAYVCNKWRHSNRNFLIPEQWQIDAVAEMLKNK